MSYSANVCASIANPRKRAACEVKKAIAKQRVKGSAGCGVPKASGSAGCGCGGKK